MRILVILFSLVLISLQAIDTAVLVHQNLFAESSCCEVEDGSCCGDEEACAGFCCRAAMSLQIHSIDYPKKEKSVFSFRSILLNFYNPSAPDILTGFHSIPEQPPKTC